MAPTDAIDSEIAPHLRGRVKALGPPLEVFSPSAWRLWFAVLGHLTFLTIMAVAGCLFVAIALTGDLWIVFAEDGNRAEADPYMWVRLALILVFSMFCLLVVGPSNLRRTVGDLTLRVWLCPEGLVTIRRKQMEVFGWEEIAAISDSRSHGIVLVRRDGYRFHISRCRLWAAARLREALRVAADRYGIPWQPRT